MPNQTLNRAFCRLTWRWAPPYARCWIRIDINCLVARGSLHAACNRQASWALTRPLSSWGQRQLHWKWKHWQWNSYPQPLKSSTHPRALGAFLLFRSLAAKNFRAPWKRWLRFRRPSIRALCHTQVTFRRRKLFFLGSQGVKREESFYSVAYCWSKANSQAGVRTMTPNPALNPLDAAR